MTQTCGEQPLDGAAQLRKSTSRASTLSEYDLCMWFFTNNNFISHHAAVTQLISLTEFVFFKLFVLNLNEKHNMENSDIFSSQAVKFTPPWRSS